MGPPVQSYEWDQAADDIAAFCQALGIASPAVLGHSAGGFIALSFAARHPECVGRLILLDTAGAWSDTQGNLDILERRAGSEARRIVERFWSGVHSEAIRGDFSRLVFPAYFGEPAAFDATAASFGRTTMNADVGANWYRDGRNAYDLRGSLSSICAPALVLVGEHDWITPPGASQKLVEQLPNADLVILPGVGHFMFSEAPE